MSAIRIMGRSHVLWVTEEQDEKRPVFPGQPGRASTGIGETSRLLLFSGLCYSLGAVF